jgi:hypothetical protein
VTTQRHVFAPYLDFCLAIRALALIHRVSVVSWWRTEIRNRAEGGIVDSRHLDGLGADLIPDATENRANIITTARSLGLQVVDEGDHIHIELDPI